MKLSDAILAGSTLVKIKRNPHAEDEDNGEGCALTMAAKAVGKEHWNDCFGMYPWLHHGYLALVGIFDSNVCRGTMTLDQFIDYVRKVEPLEDEQAIEGEYVAVH